MKIAMITLFACTIGLGACAQKLEESKVPASVVTAFKAKFTSVKSAEWEKEDEAYEANFKLNEVETSASFDVNGKLLELESEIKETDLPKAIKEALAKDYPGYKIEETSKIETKGIITYEIEVEKKEKSMDLIYDANGKLLKNIPKEEEKKD